MGRIRAVDPALLFAGILFAKDDIYEQARQWMTAAWGPVLIESEAFDFTHTDYYQREMGGGLKRKFVAFCDFVEPTDLPKIKIVSNRMEEDLSEAGRRRINIDPGYLDLAKLVLASTKDYSHRLCLGENIFGEVTMRFVKGSFQPLEWTYPDYREPRTLDFLNHARQLYSTRKSQAVPGA